MQLRFYLRLTLLCLLPAACAPVQAVETSRELLWERFGGHPVDELLLEWGAPAAETHLTDGSRLLKYHRILTYDAGSPYARTSGCEVSFLAGPPKFTIGNIAMEGSPSQCAQLAQGKTGEVAMPASYGYGYGGGYGYWGGFGYGGPFYRYRF